MKPYWSKPPLSAREELLAGTAAALWFEERYGGCSRISRTCRDWVTVYKLICASMPLLQLNSARETERLTSLSWLLTASLRRTAEELVR